MRLPRTSREGREIMWPLMAGVFLLTCIFHPDIGLGFLMVFAGLLGVYLALQVVFVIFILACEGAERLGRLLSTLNPFRRNA